jgi:hypothetical protein
MGLFSCEIDFSSFEAESFSFEMGSGYSFEMGSGYSFEMGSGYSFEMGSGYSFEMGSLHERSVIFLPLCGKEVLHEGLGARVVAACLWLPSSSLLGVVS